jgi:rhodanese-related sulfurtransferase
MKEVIEGCLVVDVRTPGEYAEGHVAGSINVPLHDVDRSVDAISAAAEGRRIALVCRTGQRAEKARAILRARLQCDAHVVEGGVVAWERAGRPLSRPDASGAPMSLERQVRIAAGAMVAAGTLLGVVVSAGFLAVPAFVGCGLVFAGVTDTCGLAMVLARLPWNRRSFGPEGG